MKILAIETSCDDTGIAILEVTKKSDFKVLSNAISSQTALGKKYGGVFPAMAKRAHQKNLVPTFLEALEEAKLLKTGLSQNFTAVKKTDISEILEREPELEKKLVSFLKKYGKPDIDLISVTNGPGLEPCLWVGVNFAKALSSFWNIPVVAVNHIESHILVNFLENSEIKFPAIALVVSGGHTQIILVKSIGKYEILGETRDDAAGECFDKCAKILGLGYPGGPIISKLAEKAQRNSSYVGLNTKLPRPMIGTKDYDFSFSGLKTAVLYKWRDLDKKDLPALPRRALQAEMASEVQQAIIDVLIKKTVKAVKDYEAKTLILGGGVSANRELRKQFKEALNTLGQVEVFVPIPNLSTDNALMTAITGFYHKKSAKSDLTQLTADGNLRIE